MFELAMYFFALKVKYTMKEKKPAYLHFDLGQAQFFFGMVSVISVHNQMRLILQQ
jgi:hypothetical protein